MTKKQTEPAPKLDKVSRRRDGFSPRATKNYTIFRVELSLDLDMAEEAGKRARSADLSVAKYLMNKAREGMQAERLAAIADQIVHQSEVIIQSQKRLNVAISDIQRHVNADHDHFTGILMEQNKYFENEMHILRANQERVLAKMRQLMEDNRQLIEANKALVEAVAKAVTSCCSNSVAEIATPKTGVAKNGRGR